MKLPRECSQALHIASQILEQKGIPTPRLDAELLLAKVLRTDRLSLYKDPHRLLTFKELQEFELLLQRRSQREPLPYLLGEWEFYGRSFWVTPAVLIPRPETELIVEQSILLLQGKTSPWVLEVGTGSGCIAVTLALENPGAWVIALDLSFPALEVARRNIYRYGVGDKVTLCCCRFPEGIRQKEVFDLLVSNPPYVSLREADRLPPEVREYEPKEALFAGEEGTELLFSILELGKRMVRSGGAVLLEIGLGQSALVEEKAREEGWQEVRILEDYSGIPRVLVARKEGN